MDNKILFGILTLLLNSYGVPNFMAGDVKSGILKIVLGCVTCGVIAIINTIQGIITGIKILTMSDADFAAADKKSLIVGIPKIN